MRGDVARDAGVDVVAPRAADAVPPLEHDEVVDPLRLEPEREPDPRDPRADDADADVLGHATATGSSALEDSPATGAAGVRSARAAATRSASTRP